MLLKRLQSPDERYPSLPLPDCDIESVVPLNERGPEIAALPTALVPLPINNPPSVVLPVPPKLTASVVDPTIFPAESVVKREDVIEVSHVAPVFVSIVVLACVKKVEEAMTDAFLSHSPVVVELTATDAYESIVHGHVMPVPVSVIGELPSTLNVEHDNDPAHVADVVATTPSEFAPVQYARPPTTGADDVPTPR